jgi:hypothetical protein
VLTDYNSITDETFRFGVDDFLIEHPLVKIPMQNEKDGIYYYFRMKSIEDFEKIKKFFKTIDYSKWDNIEFYEKDNIVNRYIIGGRLDIVASIEDKETEVEIYDDEICEDDEEFRKYVTRHVTFELVENVLLRLDSQRKKADILERRLRTAIESL